MSELDPEFIKQLQEAFVIEAREQLQSIMQKLIAQEKESDEAASANLSEEILHELHSMKGNSRAAGVVSAESICQLFESAILSLRRRKELLSAASADVFHAAVDLLDETINQVENGNSDFVSEKQNTVLQRLRSLDERRPEDIQIPGAEMQASPGGASSLHNLPNPFSDSLKGPSPDPSGGQATQRQAQTHQTKTGTGPAAEPNPLSQSPAQSIEANFQSPAPASTQTSGPAPVAAESGAKSAAAKSQQTDKSASTRIALWKLDKLLRESEEMLILKQMSEQHLVDMRDLTASSKSLKSTCQQLKQLTLKGKGREILKDKDLMQIFETLYHVNESLEQEIASRMRRQQSEQRLCFNMVDGFIDSVKSLLMQDFSSLLSVVPKLVRDLARELGKEVDLEVFGTEIEIDRRILEEIKDPLIHLIRNSLDHGIETSAERAQKGKPAKASLKVGAKHDESGNVQVIISDDGKGIDAEKLKLAAIKAGHISEHEASTLSKQEAIELMYHSSVSTSQQVTNISGRGIGMAIVRDRIHELGGRVIVETEINKGTSFILLLPTKLSTFRGIQILASGQSFIIPTLSVYYAGRVLRSEIKANGRKNIVTINGQLTSVQSLSDVLSLSSDQEFKTRSARNYQQLLVLEHGNRRAGFLVDEILQEHEVLVRGLSYPLVRVNNIAGATILGNGQVLPVLNVADLMETSLRAAEADAKLAERLARETRRVESQAELPVFVVDDHANSRIMLKTLLESEGYMVRTFESNESALDSLGLEEPLILIKNSNLPEGEDGGLAYLIRRDLRLKNLPIVFFGSQSVEEGSLLASEKGGNAYFNNLEFDRKKILALIERLT